MKLIQVQETPEPVKTKRLVRSTAGHDSDKVAIGVQFSDEVPNVSS